MTLDDMHNDILEEMADESNDDMIPRREALAMVAAERDRCAVEAGEAAVRAVLVLRPDMTPFMQQVLRQNVVRAIRSQEGDAD